MQSKVIQKSVSLPDGREIIIETGKLAKQADGSVILRLGDTMLLATVVSAKEAKDGVDFLPLSVDYQEKFASGGKIPGGFLKREGRLSDYEILVSRLVDRALRPLFPDDYHADTQIAISLISADNTASPDALAALAASSALAVSDIPFNGPVSEVRVSRIDGEFVINPGMEDNAKADLDLIVAGSMDSITMVEGEMDEVSEADMLEAIKVAHETIKAQCQVQLELTKETAKEEKREYSHENSDEALKEELTEKYFSRITEAVSAKSDSKDVRKEAFKSIRNEYIESLPEDHEVDLFLVNKYFGQLEKKASRDLVLKEKIRIDGRQLNEIRPIWCEVDYLPSAHGSAVFTRGETQSLTTMTLGTKLDEQLIDSVLYSGSSKFILHYNFPAFSTGEVRPNRGPGRREVGHGNLAMRALKKVMPKDDDNPYTVRIVSDILESNGSSSMATVCAGTLALMDGGFNIKAPVSGIAMGLITDSETGEFAVLSDILGDEDHLGDMDFKVTGTKDGITACQMDIKVDGLSYEILSQALEQAKEGRLHILGKMLEVLPENRSDYKANAPRAEALKIKKEFIGAVIGPGGKVIQEIQKDTGATIVIEEKDDHGLVNIFATGKESMDSAVAKIKGLTATAEEGEVYDAKVKSVMPYGAFMEFLPGKEGLLHISEIKWERLEKMDGLLEEGEIFPVKLIGIDKKTGKFRLSRKVLLPKPTDEVSG
ncbi:MAG: polyribonucleotide nucleotidyltransferase [Bacteroidota bacterium]